MGGSGCGGGGGGGGGSGSAPLVGEGRELVERALAAATRELNDCREGSDKPPISTPSSSSASTSSSSLSSSLSSSSAAASSSSSSSSSSSASSSSSLASSPYSTGCVGRQEQSLRHGDDTLNKVDEVFMASALAALAEEVSSYSRKVAMQFVV
jgi:hypothetical protein